MNMKRNKLKRTGVNGTGFNPREQRENQKSYLRNWERNRIVKPIPIPHKIRKGA